MFFMLKQDNAKFVCFQWYSVRQNCRLFNLGLLLAYIKSQE